jgi:hypothetical protein
LSKTQLRLKLFSFQHIVGERISEYDWLSQQLTGRMVQNAPIEQTETIRINSRFDFDNNLFKVLSVTNDGV